MGNLFNQLSLNYNRLRKESQDWIEDFLPKNSEDFQKWDIEKVAAKFYLLAAQVYGQQIPKEILDDPENPLGKTATILSERLIQDGFEIEGFKVIFNPLNKVTA